MSKFDLKADLPKYKMFRPPSRPWLCNLSKQFDFDSISLYRYLQGVQGMDRFHDERQRIETYSCSLDYRQCPSKFSKEFLD